MRLVVVGCEYAGTTTLVNGIRRWAEDNMAADWTILHDHYKIPHIDGHPDDLSPEQQRQFSELDPRIKEIAQRHNIYYHFKETNYDRDDHVVVGWYIEDTIYGEKYFGYGGEGQPGRRDLDWAIVEKGILGYGPDTVLVLVKASPEVIRRRMRSDPHPGQIVKDGDVEEVLGLFQDAFNRSALRHKIVIDTGASSVEESVAEFVRQVEPTFNNRDRLRVLVERAKRRGDWIGGK